MMMVMYFGLHITAAARVCYVTGWLAGRVAVHWPTRQSVLTWCCQVALDQRRITSTLTGSKTQSALHQPQHLLRRSTRKLAKEPYVVHCIHLLSDTCSDYKMPTNLLVKFVSVFIINSIPRICVARIMRSSASVFGCNCWKLLNWWPDNLQSCWKDHAKNHVLK